MAQSMITENKIDLQYEKTGGVGICSISGRLTAEQEDELKMVLMKALYSTKRAVIRLKEITKIDPCCLKLLRNAYCTSLRLKSPIIMTGIPEEYAEIIFQCSKKEERDFHVVTDHPLNYAENEFKRY